MFCCHYDMTRTPAPFCLHFQVFGLAEDTYRALCTEGEDQCVIISGESGAGSRANTDTLDGFEIES